MGWKKTSVMTVSSLLLLGAIPPMVHGQDSSSITTTITSEQTVDSHSSSASTVVGEQGISLDQLITKIKNLFPEKFASANEQDFQLEFTPNRTEDNDVKSYRVSFFEQTATNQPRHASFEFTGEELELSQFYFDVEDPSEALFPPKVSEQKAEEIARDFMKQINPNENYRLNNEMYHSYTNMNSPLTEPIEYRFTFNKLKDDIPVQNQSVSINVLSNGEVIQYNGPFQNKEATFEDTTGLKSKDVILNTLQDELDLELRYLIRRDHQTMKTTAHLTYRETPIIQGISAKDGSYFINGEYTDEIPDHDQKLTQLATSTKAKTSVTRDEAKTIAKQLLEPQEEGTTLHIEGVMENETANGEKTYDIRYMYQTGNSGHGSTVQIKQATGELIRFSADGNYNPNEEVEINVTQEQALDKAINYLEQYAYTNLDEYAYPIASNKETYQHNDSNYYFSFPRVKNGLIVEGDTIRVGVSKQDGRLVSLLINRSEIDEWPNPENVVRKDKALEAFKEHLDLELYYAANTDKDNNSLQYKLSYLRDGHNQSSFFNAVTEEWQNSNPNQQGSEYEDITLGHPWAEEELQFMIKNNIIEVEDLASFDPNQAVTKGEALEILSKSLTRIYQDPYQNEEENSPFTNIDQNHPLYDIIKRSVDTGILDDQSPTFDVDEPLTRETLAFWHIRALNLNPVADRHDIFKYDFADADEISDINRGYVVLADSLGLLNRDMDNKFLPQDEVTYAQLAVANIALAKLSASEDFALN
ncbi:PepSY1/2 domain-containing protein [Aquibacillus sediminis]|uniref:PepSY1/2 domain-containing protein n=1 Tax=Aquibacillus sediminis TaxID=2574734 RepID=UPI001108F8C1|nr:PepSY1/2 domain-containing protein [Aquibacillus sediminis]